MRTSSSRSPSATASLRELETLLLAGTRMCLLSGDQIQIAMGLGDEVGRMLTALRRSLGAPHLQPGRGSRGRSRRERNAGASQIG